MIDWNRIADLQGDIGAADFCEVVELFFEEIESELAILPAGCAGAGLDAKLHFLNGAALNLGFRRFSALCQQGESAAAAGQPERVDISATLASYAASKAAFIAGLPRLAPNKVTVAPPSDQKFGQHAVIGDVAVIKTGTGECTQ